MAQKIGQHQKVRANDPAADGHLISPANLTHAKQKLHDQGEPQLSLDSKKVSHYLWAVLHGQRKSDVIHHHSLVKVGLNVQVVDVGGHDPSQRILVKLCLAESVKDVVVFFSL